MSLPWSVYVTTSMTFLISRPLVHYRGRSTDPAATSMGEMLCRLSEEMEITDELVDILGCPYEEASLPMLGAALFERGLLAPRFPRIRPTGTITLGDVVYVKDAGDFVVVDNVHQHMQAESGTLSWKEDMWVRSGYEYLEDTSEVVESQSGKFSKRRRQVHLSVCSRLVNNLF